MVGSLQLGTADGWAAGGVEMMVIALVFGAILLFITKLAARRFNLTRSAKVPYAMEVLLVLAFCSFMIKGIIQLHS